jgi:hypothetical protein
VSDSIAWVLGEQKAKVAARRGDERCRVSRHEPPEIVGNGGSRAASGPRRRNRFFADEESELEDIDASLGNLDENAVDLEEIENQQLELSTQNSTLITNGNGFHSEEYEIEKVQAAQIGSVQTVEKKSKRGGTGSRASSRSISRPAKPSRSRAGFIFRAKANIF